MRRTIQVIPVVWSLLSFLWFIIARVLRYFGDADFLIERIDDPGWVGKMMTWIISTPGILDVIIFFSGIIFLCWAFKKPIKLWSWIDSKSKAKEAKQFNEELAERCESLAHEIKDFIFESNSGAPAFFPEEEKDLTDKNYHQFKRRADYSTQTRSLYEKKFNPRLYELVYLLKEGGHTSDKILTHGEDAWADKKIGLLLYYAETVRKNKLIT